MSRQSVFLDMSVGGKPAGKVIIELFSEVVPKTAENFKQLCEFTCVARFSFERTKLALAPGVARNRENRVCFTPPVRLELPQPK